MSRIDEALKRAVPSNRMAASSVAAERLAHSEYGSVLEHYTREHQGPVYPADAIDRLAMRTTVAPRTGKRSQAWMADVGGDRKLVVSDNAPRLCVEQFRRLAGTLHELQLDRGLKTLMVTSALPGDGKTLTVVNLALTLSESFGRRVLLIDADLRRPTIHDVLKLPNAAGLSDVLRSRVDDVPLMRVSDHLTVLTAGRADANPMAGLTSDRMRALIDQSSADFEWVLLDAAPVGLIPDARLLAGLTRAVLFVIGAGSTPFPLVTRAIGELGAECIVGTVLNRVEAHNVPANAYYEHYYGGRDGGSNNDD